MKKQLFVALCMTALTLFALPVAAQNEVGLSSVWQAQAMTPMGPIHSQLILQPNGTYTQMSVAGTGHANRVWGSWFAPAPGTLRLQVEGYAPEWYQGRHMVQPPSELVQFRFLDNNTIQTNTGVIFRRTQ